MNKTEKIFANAKNIMPGGVSSPVRSMMAIGGTPLYIKNGSGPKFTDIDERTYYDMCMSYSRVE